MGRGHGKGRKGKERRKRGEEEGRGEEPANKNGFRASVCTASAVLTTQTNARFLTVWAWNRRSGNEWWRKVAHAAKFNNAGMSARGSWRNSVVQQLRRRLVIRAVKLWPFNYSSFPLRPRSSTPCSGCSSCKPTGMVSVTSTFIFRFSVLNHS